MSSRKRCVVKNCESNIGGRIAPGVQCVSVPGSGDRMKEWLINLGREDLLRYILAYKSLGTFYVCSRHFTPDSWTPTGKIKHNVTPLPVADVELYAGDKSFPREAEVGGPNLRETFENVGAESAEEIIEIDAPYTFEQDNMPIGYVVEIEEIEMPHTFERDHESVQCVEENEEIITPHSSGPRSSFQTEVSKTQEQYDHLMNKYERCKEENKRKLEEEERQTAKRLKWIADQVNQLAEKDMQLADKRNELANKEMQLTEKERLLAEKDRQLVAINSKLAEKEKQLAEKDKDINMKERQIAKDTKIRDRLRETIQILNQQLKDARKINDDNIRNMKKNFADFVKKEFSGEACVIFENLLNNQNKVGTCRRYTTELKEWASQLYSLSPTAYRYLKPTFFLPKILHEKNQTSTEQD